MTERLTGKELLKKIEELENEGINKTEFPRACGYTTDRGGVDFTGYMEAWMAAKYTRRTRATKGQVEYSIDVPLYQYANVRVKAAAGLSKADILDLYNYEELAAQATVGVITPQDVVDAFDATEFDDYKITEVGAYTEVK